MQTQCESGTLKLQQLSEKKLEHLVWHLEWKWCPFKFHPKRILLMSHPGIIDLVAYILKPKTWGEYECPVLQFIKYLEEKKIKVCEIADSDAVLGEYIHHEFDEVGQDVHCQGNKVMSALRFSIPGVKGSLHRWHKPLPDEHIQGPASRYVLAHTTLNLGLGISYYLHLQDKPEMRLVVLIMYNFHHPHEKYEHSQSGE